jgi:hypothetical protein
MRIIATTLCWLLWLTQAVAGELIHSYVDNDGDHYYLHLDMRVKVKADTVYRILLDFKYMPVVNDTIVDSKLLKTENNVHHVYFVSEGCIWFFCKRIKQLAAVTELGQGFIMSITDPAQSDLKQGRTLWEVIDEGKSTRIKYNADYVPDFWVPPLIGPAIFKDRMYEEGLKTIHGIEKLANETKEDTDVF